MGLQHLHQREAVQMRHVQIQEHQVGLKFRTEKESLAGIRSAEDVMVAGLFQYDFQKSYVRPFIVDNENFTFFKNSWIAHFLSSFRHLHRLSDWGNLDV